MSLDTGKGDFQKLFQMEWLDLLNINMVFGIDGISIYYIVLSTLLIPICILVS